MYHMPHLLVIFNNTEFGLFAHQYETNLPHARCTFLRVSSTSLDTAGHQVNELGELCNGPGIYWSGILDGH